MAAQFYASPAVTHAVPAAYHARTFAELLRSSAYVQGYVPELEGRPAGYALTSRAYSVEAGGRTLCIEVLFVRPEFGGTGAAKAHFSLIWRDMRFQALRGCGLKWCRTMKARDGCMRGMALYRCPMRKWCASWNRPVARSDTDAAHTD